MIPLGYNERQEAWTYMYCSTKQQKQAFDDVNRTQKSQHPIAIE